MAKIPTPLRTRPVPKSVRSPTGADVATPVAKRAAKKAKPAAPAPAAAPAVARPVAQRAAKPAAPAAAVPAPARVPTAPKPKLVRDSFTMPKDEYQVIDALKRRALGLEKQVRKSELLRAGIQALAALSDRAFLKAIAAVPTLKTGRPKAD